VLRVEMPKGGRAGEPRFFDRELGEVSAHPSSALFGEKKLPTSFVAYQSLVKTSKVYVREGSPVSAHALLLFGGSLRVDHTRGVLVMDEWLTFRAPAKTAVLIRNLRRELDALFAAKVERPEEEMHEAGHGLIAAISSLLQTEAEIA
jgi:ATP-dependent RNA helicase DHX57